MSLHRTLLLAVVVTLPCRAARAQSDIDAYIGKAWDTLQRSMSQCGSVVDPKVRTVPVVYLPVDIKAPASIAALKKECGVEVRSLPRPIHALGDIRPAELPREGLLYLPNSYVV